MTPVASVVVDGNDSARETEGVIAAMTALS
jgi:hypothetical protein